MASLSFEIISKARKDDIEGIKKELEDISLKELIKARHIVSAVIGCYDISKETKAKIDELLYKKSNL